MAAVENERELTSTLHLGLRSVDGVSEISASQLFLQQVDSSVKAIIDEVCQQDSKKAMLVIHRGPSQGSRFLLDSERTSIGRSPTSDIFFDDVTVSRKHAIIQRDGDSFTIIDSQSLNGTYVNSFSVTKQVLKMGDQLQIGKFHALFFGNSHVKSQGEK